MNKIIEKIIWLFAICLKYRWWILLCLVLVLLIVAVIVCIKKFKKFSTFRKFLKRNKIILEVFALVISIITILWVYRSLIETKKANEMANENLKVTQQSLKQSRQEMQLQTIPFLGIRINKYYVDLNIENFMDLEIENFADWPAIKVDLEVCVDGERPCALYPDIGDVMPHDKALIIVRIPLKQKSKVFDGSDVAIVVEVLDIVGNRYGYERKYHFKDGVGFFQGSGNFYCGKDNKFCPTNINFSN